MPSRLHSSFVRRRVPVGVVGVVAVLLATACADGSTTLAVEPGPIAERSLFAGVNLAIADVPLGAIVFDTFDGGSVALPDATEAQVESLRNAIRPLNAPSYVTADEASYLDDGDLVLGYVADDGSAWAHPHRVLNFHEIVNIDLAGRPVVITYCPLCGSGVVFDRRPNDLRHQGTLTFDNTSALYESDMVMVDVETNTYWWHVAGRGIVGNLTGSELEILPSMTTTWAAWTTLHPQTRVLSDDQGRGPSYEFDPFVDHATRVDAGELNFPVSREAFADERLAPSTRVVGFDLDGAWWAVPLLVNERAAVMVEVDAVPRAVVLLDGHGGGSVFDVDRRLRVIDGVVVDDDGARFDLAGRSADGPDLQPLPSRTAFWFAWVAATDGATRLVGPTGEVPRPG